MALTFTTAKRLLRKELIIGFVVAGFLTALVPNDFWQALFLTGHGFWSSLQDVVLGPFLAIISFVCSVGNVPLAAAIWKGGISFGGVVSFVFADLMTLPLLWIYRKYVGIAITVRILVTFWATMSTAGLAVEPLPGGRHPRPGPTQNNCPHRLSVELHHLLRIIALIAFAGLYWLYQARGAASAERYGKGPICGMQVEKVHTPATAAINGEQSPARTAEFRRSTSQRTSSDPNSRARTARRSSSVSSYGQ